MPQPEVFSAVEPGTAERLCKLSSLFALAGLVLGVTVLLGWWLDVPFLKTLLPHAVSMKFNTALGLSAAATAILGLNHGGALTRQLSRLIGGVVATLGLLQIAQELLDTNLGIDQLFHSNLPDTMVGTTHPGRMASVSAISFVMLGLAIFVQGWKGRRGHCPGEILAATVAIMTIPSWVGFAIHFGNLAGLARYTQMAVHTAATFVLLALAVLFSRPDQGFVQIIASRTIGGLTTRKLVLTSTLVPIGLGALVLGGQRLGLYDTDHRFALHLIATTIALLFVTARAGLSLYRLDMLRAQAQHELRKANEELESRVQSRTRELSRSEERYRAIVAALSEAIIVQDAATGVPIESNESAERILGLKRGEILARPPSDPWMRAVFEDGSPMPAEAFPAMRAARTGKPVRGAVMGVYAPDGTLRWYLGNSEPMFRPGETSPFAVVSSFFDITDARAAQQELALREAKFRAVFEQAAVGMGRARFSDAGWMDVNDAFCRMLGRSREEMLATPWPDITHPEDIELDLVPFRKMGRGELDSYTVEKRFIHKEGHFVWARLSLSLVRDARGNPDYEIAVIEDITESRRALEAARASEERFRSVVDNMSEGLMLFDSGGNLSYQNPASLRIHGFHPEQDPRLRREDLAATWKAWDETGRPLAFDGWPVSRVFRGETFRDQVLRVVRVETGHEFYGSYNGSPIYDAKGKIVLGFITIRDITERIRARDELRESAERLQLALGAARLGVFERDVIGGTVTWSPQAKRIMGFSPESPVESFEGFVQRIHPLDQERFRSEAAHSGREGRSFEIEYRFLGADGRLRWLHAYGKPYFDSQGQVVRTVGVVQDVTERKQAEETVAHEREFLSRLIERLPVLVTVYDPRTHAFRFNQTFREVLGWTEEDAANGQLMELAYPDPERRMEALAHMGAPEAGWREFHVTAKSGDLVPTLWANLKMADDRHVGIGIDLRERKKAEAELLAAHEALRAANEGLERRVRERTAALRLAVQELESFSYTVSHDLRAPLRGIDGFNKRLLKTYYEQLDERGRHYLARSSAAAQRMGKLIDDLLNFSRLSRMPLRIQEIDLSSMAESVVADLREAEPERNVEVVIASGLVTRGDLSLIRSVLQNLIGNAWKYSAKVEHARIELGKELRQGRETFFVRDNGAGFDMTYADKLFGAFQRLHEEEEFEGTGIGLATVRRILHRHGGEIWASAEVGRGATFHFTIGTAEPVEILPEEEVAHDLAS